MQEIVNSTYLMWLNQSQWNALSGMPMQTVVVYSYQGEWYFLAIQIIIVLLLFYIAVNIRRIRRI